MKVLLLPAMITAALLFVSQVAIVGSNYFFMNGTVDGLTKEEWQLKCQKILNETQMIMAVFSIRNLCTQLRCMRNGPDNNIYMGFDYCLRSSPHCAYPEPNYDNPYPECCPKKDCSMKMRRYKPQTTTSP